MANLAYWTLRRCKSFTANSHLFIVLLISLVACSSAIAQSAVAVFARYNVRTAYVETVGTLYNDRQEVGSGSGLLIGDSLVLTNNHVIPLEQNYRNLMVSVRLRSRHVEPQEVRFIYRDAQRDLALIELHRAVAGASEDRCPMPIIKNPNDMPIGSSLFILGFPLNQDLSISSGLVSNQDGGRGRWQTDTIINYGNSGGPAFDINGALVGIAVGGITKWKFGDEVRQVSGVNFIIPTSAIIESPIFEVISKVPSEKRCWIEFEPAKNTISHSSESFGLPERIGRDYFVSETKDDHPVFLARHSRTYQMSFQAEPGYRITHCVWSGSSENHASDLVCNIQPGGTSAIFAFRLTSGPAFDRWRGWLGGLITLDQEIIR